MSLKITLDYTAPTPAPSCGFVATYRAKAEPAYLSTPISGSTIIPITHIGSYEGVLESNCCSGNTSTGTPWGVNAYVPITVTIGTDFIGPTKYYNATVTSPYSFPYDIEISGSFNETCSGVTNIPFSFTYLAGNISQTSFIVNGSGDIPTGCASPGISATTITTLVPILSPSNIGTIPWTDAVITPKYAGPYWVSAGTPVWDGNPLTLPSFNIDSFTPTVVNIAGDIVQGKMVFSWIEHISPSGGTFPHDTYTFQLVDTTIIGSITTTSTTNGLRGVNMNIIFNSPIPPALLSTFTFILRVLWSDGTLAGQATIALP